MQGGALFRSREARGMIAIDGDYAEGGGQVLRSSVALSAVTGQAFRIRGIRRRRTPPGLKAQHLAGVRLAARMCGARVEGDRVGSGELCFEPGPLQPGEYEMDVGTAGSLTLLLQAVLLPALFTPGPVRLRLVGGTDVRWAPPADYLRHVVLPWFRLLGEIHLETPRRGYYPNGGGVLDLQVTGRPPGSGPRPTPWEELRRACGAPAMDLVHPLAPVAIRGVASASETLRARGVAERQAQAARGVLRRAVPDLPVSVTEEYAASPSPGSAMVLWAEGGEAPLRMGADSLGAKGRPAEEVGSRAAESLVLRLGDPAPVEEHLADHLVPLLALLGGRMVVQEFSGHVQANLYVAEQFSGRTSRREGRAIVFD